MLLLILLGIAGFGVWVYFSKGGQAALTAGENVISSGVQRLADLSDSTLQLIAGFEAFSAHAYRDAKGWSIGYGHYMGPTPAIQTITQADAYDLLKSDTQTAADAVRATISVPLTQNQFDALTSFAYNVGANAFRNSTLAKKINAGDVSAVDEFSRWTKSGGTTLAALVSRRQQEAALFASA